MPVTRFYFPAAKEGEGMAANLNAAGFNVELYLEGDWPTYLGGRRNGTLMGLYLLGWGGDMVTLTTSWVTSTAQALNRLCEKAGIRMLILLRSCKKLLPARSEARAALYRQAEQMLHDDVARIGWVITIHL